MFGLCQIYQKPQRPAMDPHFLGDSSYLSEPSGFPSSSPSSNTGPRTVNHHYRTTEKEAAMAARDARKIIEQLVRETLEKRDGGPGSKWRFDWDGVKWEVAEATF